MYNHFELAAKYVHYLFTASNGKGHGIHSPFVYDFVIHVLNDHKKYPCYPKIEEVRKSLLANQAIINVEDFGAGSTVLKQKQRSIRDIAASSLKPKKYAQLLHRIARYYDCKTIVELGTSFGITTSYLASSGNTKMYTLEGSPAIAEQAKNTFQKLSLETIRLSVGRFEENLAVLLHQIPSPDLVFLDGNHQKAATLNYFDTFLSKITTSSILVFDDIHWSKEMEEAWALIKTNERVTLTIDLFFIGLVFFKPDFMVKQDFTIRF